MWGIAYAAIPRAVMPNKARGDVGDHGSGAVPAGVVRVASLINAASNFCAGQSPRHLETAVRRSGRGTLVADPVPRVVFYAPFASLANLNRWR